MQEMVMERRKLGIPKSWVLRRLWMGVDMRHVPPVVTRLHQPDCVNA